MASKEKKVEAEATEEVVEAAEETVDAPVVEKSDRQKRWEAFVAAYKISNPVKGARKEANGEFKTIPPSFK